MTYLAEPPTGVRYRTVAWLSVAAVLAYLCRNSIGAAESTIRSGLKFSESESGWFLGAFFWTYALFQVPAGALGKQYGTRAVLAGSAVLWSLGIALIGLAPNLPTLIIAQALMGLAQAAVFPCAVQSVSVWIPKARRASACAALTIGMQIGAILAAVLTGLLIERWDWRLVFLAYSAPGIVWAVGFFLSFHNHPDEDASLNAAERRLIDESGDEDADADPNLDADPDSPSDPGLGTERIWFQILTNRSILCLCGQQMFRAAGYSFFALWFPTFLQETRGVEIVKSTFLQGTVFTATLFGGLYGGTLVDSIYKRTNNLRWSRSGVGAACMLLCGLLIFLRLLRRERRCGGSALGRRGVHGGARGALCVCRDDRPRARARVVGVRLDEHDGQSRRRRDAGRHRLPV